MNNVTFMEKFCGVGDLLHQWDPFRAVQILADRAKVVQGAQVHALVNDAPNLNVTVGHTVQTVHM